MLNQAGLESNLKRNPINHKNTIGSSTYSGGLDNEVDKVGHDRTTTPKPTTQQTISSQAEPMPNAGTDPEEDGNLESIKKRSMIICLSCAGPDEAEGISGSCVTEIVGHDWKLGQVHLKAKWNSGQTTWEHLKDMREDYYPKMTAQYIVCNMVSRSKHGGDQVLQWAKKVVRDLDRAVRRITQLYDLYLDDHDEVSKKKRKQFLAAHGIEVPRNMEHAQRIDKENGNTFWQDAFGKKEVKALLDLDCFEFHPAGHHLTLGEGWQ